MFKDYLLAGLMYAKYASAIRIFINLSYTLPPPHRTLWKTTDNLDTKSG